MWSRVVLWAFIFGLFLTGCKSKKLTRPSGSVVAKEIKKANRANIQTFELNNLDFYTFSGKAKTRVDLGEQSHDVTLNIRLERDKAIWVSVSAMLGVEVARVMITPDSVKILNKLQGEYMAKPFKYIYHYVNEGMSFAVLQDVLMANVSSRLLRTENVQVASATDEFIVVGQQESLAYQYRINKENRPFSFSLGELEGGQSLEALYGNYEKTSGYNFPRNVALNMQSEELMLNIQLGYTRVSFNEPVSMPFTVSSRYKVIN